MLRDLGLQNTMQTNPWPALVHDRTVSQVAACLMCCWVCRQVVAASAGTLTAVPLGRTTLRAFVGHNGSAAPLLTAASRSDEASQRLRAVG
jgi:hypothetical protein